MVNMFNKQVSENINGVSYCLHETLVKKKATEIYRLLTKSTLLQK